MFLVFPAKNPMLQDLRIILNLGGRGGPRGSLLGPITFSFIIVPCIGLLELKEEVKVPLGTKCQESGNYKESCIYCKM